MVNMFGTTTTETRVEILKILKDGKIRELHEISKLVAKRTNAKRTTERYAPDKNQHDTMWMKKIKFDLSMLQFMNEGGSNISKQDFGGLPLLIKRIPVSEHPKQTIRIIGDKQKAYFKITSLGKEILKLCESYKRTNEKK